MDGASVSSIPYRSNDVHAMPVQNSKTVECKLRMTYEKLADTESNIFLFMKLKSMNLGTNDVTNFVRKQLAHKKTSSKPYLKVLRTIMRSKMVDAIAFSKRLRQQRDTTKRRLIKKYSNNMAHGRKILQNLVSHYNNYKRNAMHEARVKIEHLKEKNVLDIVTQKAPESTREYLSDVNVFSTMQNSVRPEEPIKPFICHESISFDKNELKILARGPKFMVREDLCMEDFNIELEKLVAKQKFNDKFNSKDDCTIDESNRNMNLPGTNALKPNQDQKLLEQREGKIEFNNSSGNDFKSNGSNDELWEGSSGSMLYNLKSKSLDFGNLKATQYKHNKMIFMPEPDNDETELLHQLRKTEMV